MKQLKETVERVVKPIFASERRKNKMREELLAHLTEIYNEELAKGVTENTALQKTLQRFGNTSDIQRDLQSSVPFYERIPQIVRSLTFAFIMYLVFVSFMCLIWSWVMSDYGYRKWSFKAPQVIWQIEPICIFILLPLVFSYLSRILPSRPFINMSYQYLGLYLFDFFISWMIWPRYKAILYEMERDMGFSHTLMVYRIWSYGFLLANIFCLLWVWKNYKRKESTLHLSPKAQHYRNISVISGILGVLSLSYDSVYHFYHIWFLLSFLFIINSVVFCIRSYRYEKAV